MSFVQLSQEEEDVECSIRYSKIVRDGDRWKRAVQQGLLMEKEAKEEEKRKELKAWNEQQAKIATFYEKYNPEEKK